MSERPVGAELEAAILSLLSGRAPTASICPSDAARLVGAARGEDWRGLMEATREVARELALAGRLRITRGDRDLDPRDPGPGPIRLRSPARRAREGHE